MAIKVKAFWAILRVAVKDTNQICKQHDIQFKKVFPPYATSNDDAIEGLENISIRDKEKINEDK